MPNDRIVASLPALVAALLSFGACATHRVPAEKLAMNLAPMPLDVLGGIPVGTDRESSDAADALARLRVSFEQASRDYEAGNYGAAAERFLAAARDAMGDAGSYTRSALAESRSSCYRNAARAWSMAGVLGKQRIRLEQAGVEDPSCQQDIVRILALLDPRH